MKYIKQIFSLILFAVLMILIISSCSDDNDSSNSDNDNLILELGNIEVGNIIKFAEYDWRILDIQDDRILIITEEIIDIRDYHNETGDITWAECSLRTYLNGEYYNNFNESEKERIIQVTNINQYETREAQDTQDYIFLLSIDEVNSYFKDDSARIANYQGEDKGWWLRSPCELGWFASYVLEDGVIMTNGTTAYYSSRENGYADDNKGIRPAMWLTIE